MYSEQGYDLNSIGTVTIKNLKLVSPIKLPKLNEFRLNKPSDFSVFNIEVVIYIGGTTFEYITLYVFRLTNPIIEVYMPDDSNPFSSYVIGGNIYHKTRRQALNHTFWADILSDSNGFYLADHELKLMFNDES